MYHIKDSEFLRGKVPMTKEEVRAVSIAKLDMKDTDICLDIGAGTGSVSIEMARFASKGKVYAIEEKQEAVELIKENMKKFRVSNIELITGKAPEDLNKVKAQLLEVNNLALEGKPEDMVITSHICRGNYHSTFFTSGPYDSVADYVFAKENVDALFLEYDDARSGGFAPLAKVLEDKKVVLGLITTKSPELEDKETVIKRIYEAAKYIPLERLCLSPQCGFASCEIGNKLTEEEQWAKLKLVKEIAEEVWKDA